MKKLILIDGHALIFRTYYAFLRRPMINSKGNDTSILYGFTKTLIELIQKERPTHLAVAFDPPAKTFRHEMYDAYKANRSETPEQIKSALDPLIEIVHAMSVPVLMKEGFEADDVIGTIAKEASSKGFTVYMVTPDKDYGQLLADNIFQYKPAKGGNDSEIIGPKEICQQYGIDDPSQVIDILTIWGDASDNIPGVRGVGEVGSKKLIAKYKSVEEIYNHLSELPEKQQAAFIEAKEWLDMSKRLVTIDTNVEIDFDQERIKLEAPDFMHLKSLFEKYEFSSLSRSLSQLEPLFNINPGINPKDSEEDRSSSKAIYREADISQIISLAADNGYLSVKEAAGKVYLSSGDLVCKCNLEQLSAIKDLISNRDFTLYGYELKSLIHTLSSVKISCFTKLADIELMHYLIMPERSHKIELLSKSYLDIELEQSSLKVQASLFDSLEEDESGIDRRLFSEVSTYRSISDKIEEELKSSGLLSLYREMEMPLIYVLADIEEQGFKIDPVMLNQYSSDLKRELDEIEKSVRDLAGDQTLNISSPKQLGVILYEKLKLSDKIKTTSKKNYSTDEETLNEFYDKHPIVPLILEYRNIKKLISTYIDPLPSLIDPRTGKIHTTFNQALTATGRLSSIRPNLQNIPVRTERGREIRKAFVPSFENGVLLSADYSQIELRLMAHLSGDNDFIEAFNSGKDIHSATASKIFKVSEDEVTKEQRSRAKTANFGIIYGISAFGLSQRLNISRAESKKLIEDYFESYPKVKEYMNSSIAGAKEAGYVETIYGRRRYLPDINSKNPVVRGLAERNAINAPIQGSAADIIKAAMIKIHKRIHDEGLTSRMILQVHDELVFDTIPEESQKLASIVKEEMEGVIKLSVPLTVECDFGKNWLEAH